MLVACALLASSPADALSLDEAIARVIERDIALAQVADHEAMLRQTARVSAALPSPSLTLSASNLPVDTFELDQEPMTQLRASVSQMFPPGDSRRWRAESERRQAGAAGARRALRQAMLEQQLRTVWAEGWLARASIDTLRARRSLFEQVLSTTRASYRAGVREARQREVLGAEANLTRLDERIERYETQLATTRSAFSEWLSPAEVAALRFVEPVEGEAAEDTSRTNLDRHPVLVVAEAERASVEAERQLARELGKGSRGISLSYGYREDPAGTERADFLSLGVTVELASLRGAANSARVSAANAKLAQATREVDRLRRELARDLEQLESRQAGLVSQLAEYRDALLPQYRQQAEATRRAFASGEARFIEVQLVLIDLLNAELEALSLESELDTTATALDYLLTTFDAPGER